MAEAVQRLMVSRQRGENVVIFGDYDVDGVSSTALLSDVLRHLGWNIQHYLPHRLEEGYGLSREAVTRCLEKYSCHLLVAVDCGSTSSTAVEWLRQAGVEVIILDHHQVGTPPPAAVALVNPLSSGAPAAQDNSASVPGHGAELCSVGLAFKLAHALLKQARQQGIANALEYDLRPLLELVALGTIADIVPLRDENRILVANGLERLNTSRRPGLRALKDLAQVPHPVSTYAVGFQLAPRLNAAGRLEDAEAALQLLLTQDSEEAQSLANGLDASNRERQAIERSMADQVIEMVRTRFRPETDYVIVEGQGMWHIGVVGIVASRVLRQFYRPTIIVGGEGHQWRGSGRSIAGFDLAAALRSCDDLLIRHGGHAMAAGLTIQPDKIEPFRERLNHLARQALRPDQLQPQLSLDAVISLGDLSLGLMEELDQIGPTGHGNPPVQFAVRGVRHQRPPQRMGRDQQHAKMWVTDGLHMGEAVCWGLGDSPLPEGTFDLAFAPAINEFNGRRSVQLKALDWRPVES
jgi:single-stranded-DNA-specific exonuclease